VELSENDTEEYAQEEKRGRKKGGRMRCVLWQMDAAVKREGSRVELWDRSA